ncbi:MAG: LytTR family DNA-binding domain-containing protein [Bacteroidota bacterium]
MNPVNCLIADDEPIARQIIEGYCHHLPHLQVVASCADALEAKAAMQQHAVDILFLDINMPLLDGISFLKTIKKPPQVIFTTAYKEYAINAFDLAACDYLLKPFSFERFIVAVDKAVEQLSLSGVVPVIANTGSNMVDAIFVKTDSKIFRIPYNHILYAEASGNYSKIVTAAGSYMPGIAFSVFEKQLPAPQFIRVHRSFIINQSHITRIEGNRVYVQTIEIPLGSNYKEAFLKQLGI